MKPDMIVIIIIDMMLIVRDTLCKSDLRVSGLFCLSSSSVSSFDFNRHNSPFCNPVMIIMVMMTIFILSEWNAASSNADESHESRGFFSSSSPDSDFCLCVIWIIRLKIQDTSCLFTTTGLSFFLSYVIIVIMCLLTETRNPHKNHDYEVDDDFKNDVTWLELLFCIFSWFSF